MADDKWVPLKKITRIRLQPWTLYVKSTGQIIEFDNEEHAQRWMEDFYEKYDKQPNDGESQWH